MTARRDDRNGTRPPFERLVAFLGSYGLAIVLLVFLLLLTLLGTLEQAESGLYLVQKKYFNSLFLIHDLFNVVPIPLPGVYLLLVLLFVNLTIGGMLRAPKRRRSLGMLIAHGGILFLLIGGFVAFRYSQHGSLQLYEGERGSTFESYQEWVVEIRKLAPEPGAKALIIPMADLEPIGAFGSRRFVADDIPFDLTVSGYLVNCRPAPVAAAAGLREVDGVTLRPMGREKEVERNAAGAYVDVALPGGEIRSGILWGYERYPWTLEVGGERWAIGLVRRSWQLPFTVQLDKFIVERHPNTRIPKVFRSEITKIEGPSHEQIKISMNAPLRHEGYTLFQSSWGPQDAGPGARLFSGFAVVRNPADHWPLLACIIVSVGMFVHFGQRLLRYLRRRES